jgi:hypothetical protein
MSEKDKEAQRERSRAWYVANKDRVIARREQRKLEDPEKAVVDREKAIERSRLWQAKNADSERERRKQWRAENLEKSRAYHRGWNKRDREADPVTQREVLRRSRKKHYEKRLAGNRKWTKENPDVQKNISLKSVYGITLIEYNQMLIAQAGRCDICDVPMVKPFIDHCHKTGRVRGLLCQLCNAAIGMMRDDPTILASAIRYLQRAQAVDQQSVEKESD